MEAYRKDFSVARLGRVLGVSRSGFYAWRRRPEGLRSRERKALLTVIQRIHEEVDQVYGAPVCSQNSSAFSSSVAPCISTVKTAHAREPDHLGSARRLSFGRSACRSVGNRGMDALGVVVLDVLTEQPSQVVLAQHHDVIE